MFFISTDLYQPFVSWGWFDEIMRGVGHPVAEDVWGEVSYVVPRGVRLGVRRTSYLFPGQGSYLLPSQHAYLIPSFRDGILLPNLRR